MKDLLDLDPSDEQFTLKLKQAMRKLKSDVQVINIRLYELEVKFMQMEDKERKKMTTNETTEQQGE